VGDAQARPDKIAVGDTLDAAAVIAAGGIPVLASPLYSAYATGAPRIADGPAWVARHNRDVRLRITAGLGTEIVRRLQDELVDAAWRDLGDAEEAKRLVRQAELAAAIGTRLMARYVEPLTDDELVQVTRPVHRRMRLEDAPAGQPPRRTLAAMIDDSVVSIHGVSAAFRRIAGPGGPASSACAQGARVLVARRVVIADHDRASSASTWARSRSRSLPPPR
jgi:hypothetical protein